MRFKLTWIVLLTLFTAIGCSKEKSSDLAQEMAAQRAVLAIRLLIKVRNTEKAREGLVKLEERFGHTKTFAKVINELSRMELASSSPETSLTGVRLIELQKTLLGYRKERGEWPDPGVIAKPLDAWDNELYWIVAEPYKDYDLLIVSAGADGEPGTGDELLVIWVAPELEEEMKKSKTGHKGKNITSKNKNTVVMTLDDLMTLEEESGSPSDRSMTLKQFKTSGEASKKAGQPRRGETIMSLEEIKTKL